MAAVDDGGLQGKRNGSSGWWQLGESVVGSRDGWQQLMVVGSKVKNFRIFFVPNELKSPEQHVFFCFYPHLGGGWVVQKQMWINPHFF